MSFLSYVRWYLLIGFIIVGGFSCGGSDNSSGPVICPTEAPTGLLASDLMDDEKITLTWDETLNATGYSIYRGESESAQYESIGTSDTNSYDDTDASIELLKVYYYKITATKAGCAESPPTSFEMGMLGLCPTTPPTGFAATDKTVEDRVELTWDTVNEAEEYTIYRSDTEDGEYTPVSKSITNSASDQYAVQFVTYYYKVSASKKGCPETELSASDAGTSGVCATMKPKNVTATEDTYDNKIELTWDSIANTSQYTIYRSLTDPGEYAQLVTTTTNAYTDLEVLPNFNFYYKITATITVCESETSKSDYAMGTTFSRGWYKKITEISPSERSKHSAVWTGEKMIVFGGEGEDYVVNNETWAFDPKLETWTNLNPENPPSARSGHSAFVTGDKMIIFGGSANYTSNNETWEYDIPTNTWTKLTPSTPPSARSSLATAWTGTIFLQVGGGTGGGETWQYDPAANAWTNLNPNPTLTTLYGASGVWTGEVMLVYTSSVMYQYGLKSNAWTDFALYNAPLPRSGQSAVWTGKKMVIFGLNKDDPIKTWEFEPKTGEWTGEDWATEPSKKQYTSTVWADSRVILFGGYIYETKGNYYDETWTYYPY